MARHNPAVWQPLVLLFLLISCNIPADRPLVQDFVADTSAITAMVIADHTDTLILYKEDGKWLCDSKPANAGTINKTLRTLGRLQLFAPVRIDSAPKTAIVRKITLYKSKKSLSFELIVGDGKSILVYPKHKIAQEVFLPGSLPLLADRFPVHKAYWQANQLFTIPVEQVTSIETHFYNQPAESWKLHKQSNYWVLSTYTGDSAAIDSALVLEYLYGLQTIEAQTRTNTTSHQAAMADTVALFSVSDHTGQHWHYLAQSLLSTTNPGEPNLHYLTIRQSTTRNYFVMKYMDYDLVFIPSSEWLLIKK